MGSPGTTKSRAQGVAQSEKLPSGLSVRRILRRPRGSSGRIAWSPNGLFIASPSEDAHVVVWNVQTGQLVTRLTDLGSTTCVAWHPREPILGAVGHAGFALWETQNWQRVWKSHGKADRYPWINFSPVGDWFVVPNGKSLDFFGTQNRGHLDTPRLGFDWADWDPHGRWFAACGDGGLIVIPAESALDDASYKDPWRVGNRETVWGAAWSKNGRLLALGGSNAVKVFDATAGRLIAELEGHPAPVVGVSYSADGKLLASQGVREGVILWRTDTGSVVAEIPGRGAIEQPCTPRFHPTKPQLAITVDADRSVQILELDVRRLLRVPPSTRTTQYVNAKVVLCGNTSVGKSGLGLVLAGRKFRATESTHGRHIWTFDSGKELDKKGLKAIRETLLWDLAGQPGYRLIHQLHLHEVAVALVLFDSRSEIDPFSGVAYWAKALDEATRGFPLKKFLVASRCDRGGPQVSPDRIAQIAERYSFDGFFETSAKRGDGIGNLKEAIVRNIAWKSLPKVTTNELFKAGKLFLLSQKKKTAVLFTEDELLERFRKQRGHKATTSEEFGVCLGRMEAAGLIRRLSWGGHVLLQPEMLDDYCGWMALSARTQPDGLGYLSEDQARAGNFEMDRKRKLRNRKKDEATLLVATIEELVSRNVAHRQQTAQGPMLVFPSELNAELPDYPGGYALAMAFRFEGSVSGVYATLAVRLINSEGFRKRELYKNAALFTAPEDQICGFAVEYPDRSNDSIGRMVVFFGPATDRSTRLLFLRYVNSQLEKLAFKNTVTRERIYHCGPCNYTIPRDAVEIRVKTGQNSVICSGCGRNYPMDDLVELSVQHDPKIADMEAKSREEQERQSRLTVLPDREKGREFHVFLCHNSSDKAEVRLIERKLRQEGLLSWLDEQQVLAGDRFTRKLEHEIDRAGVVAVIIGPLGLGRWQDMEYQAALQRSVEERDSEGRPSVRLIPVLLPGVTKIPDLPVFLRGLNYVDLRKGGADNKEEIKKLVTAILSEGL